MGHELKERLEALSTAATDNIQWTLSQAEVDHLKLEASVMNVESARDLPHLRRQFDIYYSRIATFLESPLFAVARERNGSRDLLASLENRRDVMVDLIDVGDSALLANLDRLKEVLDENLKDARELALIGVVLQVEATEEKRLQLFSIMSRLAKVVLALFGGLLFTALLLGWMYKRGRRLAEERREAASRMGAMIASSLDAILVVDKKGRIQAYNGAAEAIFGYERDEAIGQRMEELIIPPHLREAHWAGMNRFKRTGQTRVAGRGRIPLEAMRKSGEVFPVEMALSVSESGSGTVFVSYIRDISDRIAAEKELLKARDDALAGERAKADLLTVMSHEMRTPLTGVLGAIDLLEGTGPTTEQGRYLNAMRVSGELLLHHVNDVLQLSSLEAGMAPQELSDFDLKGLLEGLVDSQSANAGSHGNELILQYALDEAATRYTGSPRALQQVLLNLIGNAIKFTRDGAIILDVMPGNGADMVEFHVSDTGQGIAPDDLERIFDDFITLDASYGRGSEGTGLGLAITRRILHSLGGSITCESELGEGSLFIITLPLQPATTLGEAAQNGDVSVSSASRVLVVEDNDINRELLKQMLEQQGHEVTTAPGGAEAVAACAEHSFDLVLMDISMPEVDGIEAITRIRKRKLAEGTEIVALTAHTAAEDHARIIRAGFAEVATKPISRHDLASVIARRSTAGVKATLENDPETPRVGVGGEADQTAKAVLPPEGDQDGSDILQFFEALGAERAKGYLEGFEAELDLLLNDLEGTDQLETAHRKEAHRLAGSAAVLGLTDLRQALLEIEMAEGDAVPVLDGLRAFWGAARDLLQKYVA
ncbi:hybrid sensor histidine kinase/response regulator [Roseobacter sp. SK209-2-6]|uniref:hybrid sensor histidine kinase/response regulator n=1 Tax=Roseobacter sp. SK209-2-6 TaxID=388739 RepID=UPI001E4A0705|nr:PAS domain-containing hybrid sensor histidine kinase/response regulator [Roseobacter sp. SK209-2-6]